MRAKNLDLALRARGPFDPDDMTVSDAKAIAREFYVGRNGYRSAPKMCTPPEAQLKLGKAERPAYGISLAPADASGEWNVCTWATAECRAVCVLSTSGNARYVSVQRARAIKTRFLAEFPQAFVTLVAAELRAAVRARGPIDFRPNVASDLRWEHIAPRLLTIPDVRVYDYTKAPARHREPSDNYRLTFSVSEHSASVGEALRYLQSGGNAAVVFATRKGEALPATFRGFPVIDGDATDARADDPPGSVVGLRAKGSARGTEGSATGFVKPSKAS